MIKVYENIYMNEIPLPNNPLRVINSYIIVSKERNLIIDSGFNTQECRDAFMNGLKELGINLKNTDLFITHLHSDHSGLAAALSKEGATIYAGEVDGQMINNMSSQGYWDKFSEYKLLFDLQKDDVSFDDHPGYRYCPKEPIEFIALKEGDYLNIGDYKFKIIDVPGHTPGHIALYEENHKLFFGGDHVLDKITPNIAFWGFEKEILSVYLESLDKVRSMDIDYLFAAHRNIIRDHQRRIDELKGHHKVRLEEILDIIKMNPGISVRDTASKMEWSVRGKSWIEFPNPQKWFASGEAMSHLEHLIAKGLIKKELNNGVYNYFAL